MWIMDYFISNDAVHVHEKWTDKLSLFVVESSIKLKCGYIVR